MRKAIVFRTIKDLGLKGSNCTIVVPVVVDV